MDQSRYKVLVVEDEQWVRKSIAAKIDSSGLGFAVEREATNGHSALQYIEEDCPDLLVTDIRMPVMDGIELLRALSFSHPGIRTIIVSGFNDFEYAQAAIKYGVADFLLKPVSEKDLRDALQAVRIKLDAERGKELVQVSFSGLLSDQEEIAKVVGLYIRENFRRDISLADISKKLGITTDYLSKAFKKYAGETPLKYIIKLRMNEAKRLLVEQKDSDIHYVGEYVGYRDQYYFSRIFKTYVGVYPSEYRQDPKGVIP